VSSAIQIQNLSKTFALKSAGVDRRGQPFLALDAINLEIRAGEFFVIVGPSGCGKSTLLDLLGGLTKPTSGRILIDGRPIKGPALDRGLVFQQYALFPWRTAQKNVEFGLEAKRVPRRERAEIAREYLALVGLADFADRYPHELSGGMKQRVAIARSLAYKPEVLLMDEPFAALDEFTRHKLQADLLDVWRDVGCTVVFVTHSIYEAAFLARRIVLMTPRPGRVAREMTSDLPRGAHTRLDPAYAALVADVTTAMEQALEAA
jgi:NitT/TauT family transport system ATP-binding protein